MEGRIIKLAQLLDSGACDTYTDRFEVRWPDAEVLVTVELAVSQAQDWDWDYAAEHFLTLDGAREYFHREDPFRLAYGKTMAPQWEAVDNGYAEAAKARDAVVSEWRSTHPEGTTPPSVWTAAGDAANAVMQPLRNAADETNKVAALALETARAQIFAEIYIKEGASE